jgi:hypothetical protein
MRKVIKASEESKARKEIMSEEIIDDIDDIEDFEEGLEEVAIMGASADEAFGEELDNLKADFDYIMEGLEKMDRDGKSKEALGLVLNFQDSIRDMTEDIASQISGSSNPDDM